MVRPKRLIVVDYHTIKSLYWGILTTMEYQVPQFIEVEDKIIGRFTLRQFIYLAGASGLCVVFFSYLPFVLAVLLSIPVGAFGAALAFYKMNGKPFIEILEAGFRYYTSAKLLLWKQVEPTKEESAALAIAQVAANEALATSHARTLASKFTRGKLSELAWSLDVQSARNGAKGLES